MIRQAVVLLLMAGCASRIPQTRYYTLNLPDPLRPVAPPAEGTVAIEPFAADAAYETDRIVYRTGTYRIDYYFYHRWSAPPAMHLEDQFRQALAESGRFQRIVAAPSREAAVTLEGRVINMEEVDLGDASAFGRLTLELALKDNRTGRLLWAEETTELVPMHERSPEALARALSIALSRIVQRTAPAIAGALPTVQSPAIGVPAGFP